MYFKGQENINTLKYIWGKCYIYINIFKKYRVLAIFVYFDIYIYGFNQTGIFGAASTERESMGEDAVEGPSDSRGEGSSE